MTNRTKILGVLALGSITMVLAGSFLPLGAKALVRWTLFGLLGLRATNPYVLHFAYHLAGFAFTGLVTFQLGGLRQLHKVATFLVLLALVSEMGEALLYGGMVEWIDMAADLCGILVAAVFRILLSVRIGRRPLESR